MKTPVGKNMPYAHDLFSRLGEVTAVLGCPVPIAQLADVGTLMVRSITEVGESLLVGEPIKFVGTAIAGTDRADETWSKQTRIDSSAASGCNAVAVVGYVFSSLLMLAERGEFSLHERTVGIVGVDNVGRRLQARLEALGIRTLLCGPPCADRGNEGDFRSLDELVQHANILTFRTPLFKDGPYRTLHLADEKLICSLKPKAILISARRGVIVDNTALLSCLSGGQRLSVVLDVWEGEPELNAGLLREVDIGMPRVAGYILKGKARGTTQAFEAYSKFIGHEQHVTLDTSLPAPELGRITLHDPLDQPTLKGLVHLVYDVRRDDAPLRRIIGIPGEFDRLRKNYLEHREWPSLYVVCDDASAASLLYELGFNAVYHPAR